MIDDYVRNWLIKANNDLRVAGHELNQPMGQAVTEAICFHAQQAAEKFLKGYLAAHSREFGKTHNLEYLLQLCIALDRDFRVLDTKNLTDYAVEVRYPDEFYTPTPEEARAAVRIAKSVRKFVQGKLKVKSKELKGS